MRLAVLKERRAGETRVAATPDTVRKLVALGLEVAVEAGAGQGASIPDRDFESAGASVVPDARAALSGAGVVLAVQTPEAEQRALIPRGALLISISGALADRSLVPALAAAGIDAAAMELLPRITRAQSMDVLSSQANLAGYRAVIEGANAFDRGFAMMMTAAGTVPPARVFVLGAGVAGLQAIATARRLGAIVSATDVRPAAKEEIKSLGATFVGVEDEETAKQTGAYAREMTDDFRRKQSELVATTTAKNDMIICTALVQGGKAPILVTQAMVDGMKPGSVIVDLASDGGGNCEATHPGELFVTPNGVKVLGYRNWPGRIPVASSTLYAKNLLTFLTTFWDKDAKAPRLPEEDEIVRGVMLTRGGAVVHKLFVESPAASTGPAPESPVSQPPAPEPPVHEAAPSVPEVVQSTLDAPPPPPAATAAEPHSAEPAAPAATPAPVVEAPVVEAPDGAPMLVADAPPAATSAPESDVASSSVAPSDVAASDSPSSDPLATGAPMPDGTPRPRRRRTLKAGETEAATKSGETEA
jgi:NAD(P) transhydrogenase subunit alpha